MGRAWVTGARGFVGPHLVRALQEAGDTVWTTDRAAPAGAAGGASAGGAAGDAGGAVDLGDTSGDHHVPCDLTEADAVADCVAGVRPDTIYHLASMSSVAASFEAPQETLRNNLLAACNVLEAARRLNPRPRVLLVGSAEQYGVVREDELPLRESQPFRPASPYAVAKVAQEVLGQQYQRAWDLPVLLTRSFNHSGPGQSDRFVLASFARQIAAAEAGQAEPVLRVGNLDVARDFLDVRDVVRAYGMLMRAGEPGTPYNVCRGEATPLRAALDVLCGAARVEVRVEVDPARLRPADLPVLCGDPSRLNRATGWTPRIAVEQMLADLLDDWRQRIRSEVS